MYLVLLGNISFVLLDLIGFVLLNYTIFIKASFAFLSALLLLFTTENLFGTSLSLLISQLQVAAAKDEYQISIKDTLYCYFKLLGTSLSVTMVLPP